MFIIFQILALSVEIGYMPRIPMKRDLCVMRLCDAIEGGIYKASLTSVDISTTSQVNNGTTTLLQSASMYCCVRK